MQDVFVHDSIFVFLILTYLKNDMVYQGIFPRWIDLYTLGGLGVTAGIEGEYQG